VETKVYTLTDDGSNQNAENPQHYEEEERIEALLHDGTRLVFQHLGIDLSGNINRQLEDMQIILENRREEKNPLIRGVYILQKNDRQVLPIAFIGNIETDGEKIQADIVMFDGGELEC
jgi:hypothetical protein